MKLCECGCGKEVPLSKYNDKRRNHIKGQPIRFIHGHNIGKKEKSPAWKGGLSKTKGYIRININGEYKRHARAKATKALGKSLPRKSIVHHFDGTKNNDKNGNLVLCQDQAYHLLLHIRERAYRDCGNPNFLKCRICKKYDDPENLTILKGRQYHKKCAAEYQRNRIPKKHMC